MSNREYLQPVPLSWVGEQLQRKARAGDEFTMQEAAISLLHDQLRDADRTTADYARMWSWPSSTTYDRMPQVQALARQHRTFWSEEEAAPPPENSPESAGTGSESAGTGSESAGTKSPNAADAEGGSGMGSESLGTGPESSGMGPETYNIDFRPKSKKEGVVGVDAPAREEGLDEVKPDLAEIFPQPSDDDEPEAEADEDPWAFVPEADQSLLPEIEAAWAECSDALQVAHRYVIRRGRAAPTSTVAAHIDQYGQRKTVAAYVIAGCTATHSPLKYAIAILENDFQPPNDQSPKRYTRRDQTAPSSGDGHAGRFSEYAGLIEY